VDKNLPTHIGTGDTLFDSLVNHHVAVVKQRLVGDTVSVAGVTGEILEVNLSACIIFFTEHETATVPNAKVWGNPIRNVSRNTKQV